MLALPRAAPRAAPRQRTEPARVLRLMLAADVKWPKYGLAVHKGYGVPRHLAALREHGPCPIHRRTFAPIKHMV